MRALCIASSQCDDPNDRSALCITPPRCNAPSDLSSQGVCEVTGCDCTCSDQALQQKGDQLRDLEKFVWQVHSRLARLEVLIHEQVLTVLKESGQLQSPSLQAQSGAPASFQATSWRIGCVQDSLLAQAAEQQAQASWQQASCSSSYTRGDGADLMSDSQVTCAYSPSNEEKHIHVMTCTQSQVSKLAVVSCHEQPYNLSSGINTAMADLTRVENIIGEIESESQAASKLSVGTKRAVTPLEDHIDGGIDSKSGPCIAACSSSFETSRSRVIGVISEPYTELADSISTASSTFDAEQFSTEHSSSIWLV